MSEKNNNSKTNIGKNKKTNNTKNKKKKRRKKKSLGFRVFMTILFILILTITIGATIFVNTVDKLNKVEIDNSNLGIADHNDFKEYENYTKIKNIMLFGTDAPNSDVNGRSDSMMLLTIDPIHNKIKVTSLMRDSYVEIDKHGEDKLNHAYAFGGPELAIKTINENFGLNVKEFVTVNFATLPQVIDILGGVDIEITAEELDDVNAVIKMDNYDFGKSTPLIKSPGLQTITGQQALSYSRNRSSAGGDFARTERQRTVISALFKKGLETPITSYPSILNKVLPLITTNMSSSDILSLGKNIVSIGNGTLEQARFPSNEYAEGGYIGDYWYLLYDRETTKEQIRDYIFDDYLPEDDINKNDNSTSGSN